MTRYRYQFNFFLKAAVLLIAGLLFTPHFAAATNVELKSLSPTEGLSDLLVNTIYKDSEGFVWFGTEMGIDRFDGNQLKSFEFPKSATGSHRVNAITEVKNKGIFVGNRQGLFVIHKNESAPTRLFPDKLTNQVTSLAADGANSLYVGTKQGIYQYDISKNNLRHVLLDNDMLSQDNEVSALKVIPDKGLWAVSPHKLHFLDFITGKISSYQIPASGEALRMAGNGNYIYIGTYGSGIIPFDIKRKQFQAPLEMGNNIITSMNLSADGNNLYISTDGEGIFDYSLSTNSIKTHLTSHADSPLRLKSNSVYSLAVDNQGLLWIGYYQSGAEYTPYSNDVFEVYTYPGVIDTHQFAVRAIAVNGDEKLIGTREGLYYINERTGESRKFVKPAIRSNIIFSITKIKGLYHIGTYTGGMYIFNPSTKTLSNFKDDDPTFTSGSIFSIEPDASGNIWIGTSNGVYCFRDGKMKNHFTSTNSQLPAGNVYEIFFDSAGRGWFCTENGMALWTGSEIRTDRFPKGFIQSKKIRDIFEDSDHYLYFAPDRGEVFRSNLNLTTFGTISTGKVDATPITTFITEDNDGWLWLGTDRGIMRYNKENRSQYFNNADGLPHLVFTLCPPVKDKDGNIWMGNTNGLLKLDYDKFKASTPHDIRSVQVSDFKSNGKSIVNRLTASRSGQSKIVLADNENDLEISIANLSYIPSKYFLVEYILEGYDSEWKQTDGMHPIHYYDLPSGNYTFKVRNPGSPESESTISIHKSAGINWWAVATILIIIGGGGVTFLRIRRKRAAAAARQEEEVASETVGAATYHTELQEKKRYKTTSLSDEECKRLLKVLDAIMQKDRPFTNPDLRSLDLAEMANTTTHALSYLFNQYLKKSYYDYVNEYRVNEFKRLVKERDISKYTLTALSEKCGFSSRASFFRHFKSITGLTPAEYIAKTK